MLHKSPPRGESGHKHMALKPVLILARSSFVVPRIVSRQTTVDSELLPVKIMKGDQLEQVFNQFVFAQAIDKLRVINNWHAYT
jgi:hypothetical protein